MSTTDFPLGDNLRTLRKARALSLDQLAARSGVSKSMLRQVEIGKSSPTISVLWKIANGLRVPFSALLAKTKGPASVADFTAAGSVRSGKRGYRLYPLVAFQPERPMEIYYAEMDAGVRFAGEPHQGDARETVLVIEGSVTVTIGEMTSAARQDQVIQFAAGEPHSYANTGKVTARLIMTIDYAV